MFLQYVCILDLAWGAVKEAPEQIQSLYLSLKNKHEYSDYY